MKLFTGEIEDKLQAQYLQGADFEQDVICKIFDPQGGFTWYIMNQDPKDPDYLWAIVKGFEVEMGSVSKSELENVTGKWGLHMERDLFFQPTKAQEVWDKLQKGVHV